MTTIRTTAVRRLSAFILALDEAAGRPELGRTVAQAVHRLVACDDATFNQVDLSGRRLGLEGDLERLSSERVRFFEAHMHQHPLLARRHESERAMRLSDLASRRELDRLALYRECLVPLGHVHQLVVNVQPIRGGIVGLVLNRRRHDFTDEDRLLLELAGPHLKRAWLRARRAALLAEAEGGAALVALGLTPRQAEVLYWLAQGKSNAGIATVLEVSVRTVHKHLEQVFARLGVENRIAAARLAFELLAGRRR